MAIRNDRVWLTMGLVLFSGIGFAQSDRTVAHWKGISLESLSKVKQFLGLQNKEVGKLSIDEVRNAQLESTYPDLQNERLRFRRLVDADPSGNIPADALRRALEQLDAMRVTSPLKTAGMLTGRVEDFTNLLTPATAGIENSHWVFLGPTNIGGRTRSIYVNPSQTETIYIGSVGGGVWKSTNGGTNFFPVDDKMANLAVSCLAGCLTSPNTIIAGTGEGFSNGDAIRGDGLFWTSDGEHWKRLTQAGLPDFQYVNRIAISSDGAFALVAAGTGERGLSSGIYRFNLGVNSTWSLRLPSSACDVKINPANDLLAIAGTEAEMRFGPLMAV